MASTRRDVSQSRRGRAAAWVQPSAKPASLPKIISITRSGDIFETRAPPAKAQQQPPQPPGVQAAGVYAAEGTREQGPVHELSSATNMSAAQQYLALAGLSPPHGKSAPKLGPQPDLGGWGQGLGTGLLTTLGLKKSDFGGASGGGSGGDGLASSPHHLDDFHIARGGGFGGHVTGGGTSPRLPHPHAELGHGGGAPGVRWASAYHDPSHLAADTHGMARLAGGGGTRKVGWWRTRDACLALQAELLPSAFSQGPETISQLARSICSDGASREHARAAVKAVLEQLSSAAMMDEFTRSQVLWDECMTLLADARSDEEALAALRYVRR